MTIKKKLLASVLFISVTLIAVVALTLNSFENLSQGLDQIVTKAELGVTNSRTTTKGLSGVTGELDSIAARIPALAEDVRGANMRVKILDRKISGISETLDELAASIEEICETLPEGDARDELEWLSDDVGDLQETMKREALVGLKDAAKSMDASTEAIAAEVAPLLAASEELSVVAQLSEEVQASSMQIQGLSSGFGDDIELSRNTLTAILLSLTAIVTLMVLGFVRFLSRSLGEANEIAVGITGGDLKQEIVTDRKDEIGQLLSSMHAMQKGMRESLESIEAARKVDREKTAALEASSGQQRLQSEELKQAAQAQREAAERAAASAQREAEEAAELRCKVDQLLGVVELAANGDLTANVGETGDDAIGRVGGGLEQLLDRLRVSITAIAANSGTLARSSEGMTGVSGAMNTHATQSSEEANSVALAADEVSANVETIAAAIEEMNASIREIAGAAARGAGVATDAVEKAEATSARMTELDDRTTQISDIIEVITSIASQTNLLALNATIEAARAGDAGRGFAVVANEVKDLALETAKATDEITKQIAGVQESSRDAVGAIGEINEIIGQISEVQASIAAAVEEQTATTAEISRSIHEASAGSTGIATSANSMASAAQETLSGADSTRSSAGEISVIAAELAELVGQFQY